MEYCKDEDDSFTDLETEYPAIVFNDASDAAFSRKPTVSPLDNNEIDFNISFDESDDEDYMVVFDKNSFSCKIIFVDNLETDSENENDKVNMPPSLSPEPMFGYIDDLDFFKDIENEFPAIAYNDLKSKSDPLNKPSVSSQHIDKFETSLSEYDEKEQNVLCLDDSFPLNILIIRYGTFTHRDLRHPWLRYQVNGYDEGIIHSYEQRLEMIWGRPINRVHVLDFAGLTDGMRQTLGDRLSMVYAGDDRQLGGARRRMTWRQFILALGLHSEEEMVEVGFGAYWSGSKRVIPDKGDLIDYWIEISSDRDFLGHALSYVHIRDPVRRLCHSMIACSISGRGQRAEKGRKSGARLSGGHFIGRLAAHFRLVGDHGLRGLVVVVSELPVIDLHELARLSICSRLEEEVCGMRQSVVGLRGVLESSIIEQTQVSTWMISCMTQLMDASGRTYKAFDSTLVGSSKLSYERRVRPKTGEASTSTAP
ncbi:hypothetical protein Tco_0370858 [Tanacetum coccineum]